MRGPVLLCGLGSVGWRVLDFLRDAGVAVTAIDNVAKADDARLHGVRFVAGDFRQEAVLKDAGLDQAWGVLVITSDDLANIAAGLLVRRLNPEVKLILRMFNQNLVQRLGKAVPNVTALSVSALAAPSLAMAALTGEILASFPVGEQRRQVSRLEIAEGSPWIGTTIGKIDPKFLPVARRPVGSDPQFRPPLDQVIGVGDKLTLCGEPADLRKLLASNVESDVLWAGKLRRLYRVVRRTIRDIDKPVLIGFSVLILVIIAAAFIYRFGLGKDWSEAYYQTISVLTTGSDLGGADYPAWGKFFVSALKLTGTALIAAFTAIVTNYLIRMKLGGAFEVRRIPDGNHIVVCGLGNIGFRVVEELRKIGEQVVVIEQKSDAAFVSSARRKGAAVIVGDATLPDVLKQANAAKARAVIVATSSELVNLEIALMAGELNPAQRIVVRLGDTLMSETVRQAANVRLALSVPELAAPAFAAALFGDRVLAIFPLHGVLHAAMEYTVLDEEDALFDRGTSELEAEFGFTVVNRVQKWTGRLAKGDQITAIAPLKEVERLLRKG